MTNVYEQFGIEVGINARGHQTFLGGSTPPDEVQRAMLEASSAGYVHFDELLRRTGDFIAQTLGTDQAFVTSGAAASLALASAAVLAQDDRGKIARLPDTSGMKNELVFQRVQDYGYKRCFTISGAKLVEVGTRRRTTLEEMETAIGPRTAGIAFFESGLDDRNGVPVEEVRDLADRHGLPLIIDAAGLVFPLDEFRRIAQLGDIVAFAAKYFGAPQATGICTGRQRWVESALSQDFIGYENAIQRGLDPPFGRGFKTDRGSVIGATVALRRWFSIDHEARLASENEKRNAIALGLQGMDGVAVSVPEGAIVGPNVPLFVTIDPDVTQTTVGDVIRRLAGEVPPIWTRTDDGGRSLTIRVQTLADTDVQYFIARLCHALTG